jgi:hypothetical protein
MLAGIGGCLHSFTRRGKTAVMDWLLSNRQSAEGRKATAWCGRYPDPTLRQTVEGYEFRHPAVLRNVPPPTITFAGPLRWCSLDRAKRRAMAMRLRDHLQERILRLERRPDHRI